MPRLKAANLSSTTLSAAVLAADTSASVTSAAALPAVPFRCTIDSEIVEVGAKDTTLNTISSLLRGQEGTTAADHALGAVVEARWTAGMHDELAVPPDPVRRYIYAAYSGITTAVAGTGNFVNKAAALLLSTGTTAASYAAALPIYSGSTTPGFYVSSPAFAVQAVLAPVTISTAGVIRLGVGTGPYNGSDTYAGFGFKAVTGPVVYAWSCDGVAAATTTDISTATARWDWPVHFYARLVSGSRVEFYVDGVLRATHTTGLPSGDAVVFFSARVDNGTDALDNRLQLDTPIALSF